jgi:hypothetical protein
MKLIAHHMGQSQSAFEFTREGKAPGVFLVAAYGESAAYAELTPKPMIAGRVFLNGDSAPHHDNKWRAYVHDPDTYWLTHLAPHVLHPGNRQVRFWTTGLNEDTQKQNLPGVPDDLQPADLDDLRQRAAFEVYQIWKIHQAGFLPMAGGMGVGNPSGSREQQCAAWRVYVPVLRALRETGGRVHLHAYHSVAGWEHPLNTLIEVQNEHNMPVPIWITEAGYDLPPWRSRPGLTAAAYALDLIQWDQVLHSYPRVECAAIYTFGTGGNHDWQPFNVDGERDFLPPLIAHGQATAGTRPLPQFEEPLFSFHGNNKMFSLYFAPDRQRYAMQRRVTWMIDVFEMRDGWWRLTRRDRTPAFWMQAGT